MTGQTNSNFRQSAAANARGFVFVQGIGGGEGPPGLSAVQHLGGSAWPGNLDRMTTAVGKRKASLTTRHHVMQMLLASLQEYEGAARIFGRSMCQE